ncbi:MAG: neutral/alkaline non-lysosomal ceramidase N-terminal domain-containing protein [Planctomycetota bacterium]|nr:neutral/alkaline non-lysosomal ceramidase N-terminal domain-containing protein [Planctomycetota bacterium]
MNIRVPRFAGKMEIETRSVTLVGGSGERELKFRKTGLIVFLIAITASSVVVAKSWRAGAAAAAITPQQPMWMAGYAGRNRPADGKLTDLWVKALVLTDGRGRRAVLITADLIGIDRTLSQSICKKLKVAFGIEREQIAICTSHTHTGPVVAHNLRPMHYELLDEVQQKLVEQYAKWLEGKVINVVGAALTNLHAANISWGSGRATFAVNRRNNSEADVPTLRAAGNLRGPSDHDVPVLAVRDPKGRLKAVVFGYACHATVLSFFQWSGDYPGFAQMELEKTHPDCVAMFWAGCGGDQNPLPRRKVELAQAYGKQLAVAVDRVLATTMTPVRGEVVTGYTEINLPLGTLPSRESLAKDTQSTNRFVASRAKRLLAQFDKNGSLSATYPYPIGVWRIGGDVQFVMLGGEVVVDYAVRLKRELTGRRSWVAGYANDVMAYIPSRRVLREGGYEGLGAMVYYGLPTAWSPDVEEMIVEEVRKLAGKRGK